ncbi:9445_t:CDS:1, partial [Rhizophagus irregularis]
KQLNEILESKNSQTSVQVSEMLISEDLNECIFNLKKLGM